PASATDVLGARAYTWSNNNAFRPGAIPGVPMFGAGAIPTSGPELERVSQGIMNLERAAPETLGRWTNDRDATAGAMLEATVTDILAGNTVERRSSVDPALSTNSSTARGVAAATAGGMQRWQAHHLVPFAEVASLPVATQQAIAASGWRMDSPGNLIALPADIASFQGPPNNGALPMHSGAHPNYSAEAGRMLNVVAAAHTANPNMTPQEMRALMTTVETEMRAQIHSRMWHNVVR
ncbi:MAG: AHH domain-containing protein, partial [Myxococcota bacterium]